jgi:DNA invertase Pin-like site-specific DNA recombinase
MGNRTVIYIRIAPPEQGDGCESYAKLQHDACLIFCRRHGLEVVGTLVDVTCEVGLDHRPKLDELRQMICKRQIDVVVVYNLGRLSPSTADLVILASEAKAHEVTIYSIFELVPTGMISPLMAEAMTYERERAAIVLSEIEQRERQVT